MGKAPNMQSTLEKTYLAQVTWLLALQAEAITQAAHQLSEYVERTVELLAACKGKIVLVGVGKWLLA